LSREFHLEFEEEPSPDQVRFLEDRLHEFNVKASGISDGRYLAIFVRGDDGATVAGLFGHTWGGCCEIRLLWVNEELRGRGLGRSLMEAAEAEARRRGSRQILVATHSFQAPDFYRRLGFLPIVAVEDQPEGHQHLLFLKKLAGGA